MSYWFRELYEAYRDYRGDRPLQEVFQPKLAQARSSVDEFRPLAKCGSAVPKKRDAKARELLWNMYALSRVVDLTLLPHQPQRIDMPTPVPMTIDELSEFLIDLGFTVRVERDFHPFFHEIVALDDVAEVKSSIGRVYWPSYFLDDLLFLRSGVSITAPERSFRKSVCENSALYWSYVRRNRPTEDLSVGWGSNSQWRTEFRRDLVSDETLVYNADGPYLLGDGASSSSAGPGRGDMPEEAWIDFVRHRCFVLEELVVEPWPYDYRVEEKRSQ